MFDATIAGVIAGVYRDEPVAALIAVPRGEGLPVKGARFSLLGRELTLRDAFDHRPEAPDFPVPDGRIVTMIVTPDSELFELSADLAGQTVTITD